MTTSLQLEKTSPYELCIYKSLYLHSCTDLTGDHVSLMSQIIFTFLILQLFRLLISFHVLESFPLFTFFTGIFHFFFSLQDICVCVFFFHDFTISCRRKTIYQTDELFTIWKLVDYKCPHWLKLSGFKLEVRGICDVSKF